MSKVSLTEWALVICLVFANIALVVTVHKYTEAMEKAEFWFKATTNAVFLSPTATNKVYIVPANQ